MKKILYPTDFSAHSIDVLYYALELAEKFDAKFGTKVIFRYELEIENEAGELIELEDIYGIKKGLASLIYNT